MRNTSTKNHETLKSIGSITPEKALEEAFGITDSHELTRFDHKTIIDIGAGFSSLLDHIARGSKPDRFIAVDPIYGGGEINASAYTQCYPGIYRGAPQKSKCKGGRHHHTNVP